MLAVLRLLPAFGSIFDHRLMMFAQKYAPNGRLLFLVLVSLGLWFSTRAQGPVSERLTTRDGLPSSEIYDVIQDRNGYIWVCSDQGVARLNGYDIEVFTTADGLPGNVVFTAHEGPDGRIWFTTFTGDLFCYYQGHFEPTPFNQELKESGHSLYIRDLRIGSDGTVWIVSRPPGDDLLISWHPRTGLTFHDPSSEHYFQIEARRIDKEEVIVRINNSTLIRPEKGHIPPVNFLGLEREGERDLLALDYRKMITHSLRLGIGISPTSYLISVGSDLHLVRNDGTVLTRYLAHEVLCLNKDDQGRIWAGTREGAIIIDTDDLSSVGDTLLRDCAITGMTQDRELNYWFTTLHQGVYRIPFLHSRKVDRSAGLDANRITSMARIDSTIYAITPSGMFQATWPKLSFSRQEIHFMDRRSEFRLLSKLLPFQEKQLLVMDGHIGILEPSSGAIESLKFRLGPKFYKNGRQEPNGDYLFWGNYDICTFRFSPDGEAERLFDSKKRNMLVRTVMGDGDGYLVGTPNGLFHLDHDTKELSKPPLGEVLNNSTITDLQRDDQSRVWIATRGEGIAIRLDSQRIQMIRHENGLVSNMCNLLFADGDGRMWVATPQGVNRIQYWEAGDTLAYRINTFSASNGLISGDVHGFLRIDSVMLLATNQGIQLIEPERLFAEFAPPLINLRSLLVNERDTTLQSDHQFGPRQNNLEIGFEGIWFRERGGLRYQYRLNGQDAQWSTTTARRVRYSFLPPGDYEFEVFAELHGSNVRSESVTLRFSVLPHFTQTWWFLTLVLLTGALLILVGVRLFIRSRLRKASIEKQIILSEQQALRAQMNPHFIFNTMNAIQQFISLNDKRSAYVFLSKSSRLIRNVLDNSRTNFTTVEEEIRNLKMYLDLESLRFGGGFRFSVRTDEHVSQQGANMRIPAMLIQPYLENAIWHGLMPKKTGERVLELALFMRGDDLHITVTDNGIGRARAQELKKSVHRTSTAMKNIENRMQLLNRMFKVNLRVKVTDLTDDHEEACGTEIHLILPPIP